MSTDEKMEPRKPRCDGNSDDAKASRTDFHQGLTFRVTLFIREGVLRMEDIIKGQTGGLTESQFRSALG